MTCCDLQRPCLLEPRWSEEGILIKGTDPPWIKSSNIPEICICQNVRYVPLITFVTFYPKIFDNGKNIDV